ncbi:hypothetical protein NQ314_010415 [Rhamnusium bicolor]|uniref:PH domain-containing protein n=1 Tax=Rhamnusium bicolor TaxID=1586634 RepID=A0AAV8XQP3_9CUCU|nr:hypothetical protein NQ314_010415 [Rhamnusium bicolor]
MNNLKINSEATLIKVNNKYNLISKTYKDCAEKPEHMDEKEHRLPKLKIALANADQTKSNCSVINVVNDFSKVRSPIIDRNSTEFFTGLKETPSPIRHNRPIMGRAALLKKANIEPNDSQIVHELITDKYNGVLNYYFDRMYQRRLSKTEGSEDDYSDTVFSSPNYSPLSVSSISTTNSTFPDEKSGFSYPNSAVSTEKMDFRFIRSTDDMNIETTVEDIEDSSMNLTDAGNEKTTALPENPTADNGLSDNPLLENLMRELSIQNEIMFQVSKALNFCRTTKEFESSKELIEAEKILLVTSCMKEALINEIQNMEDETYERKDDHRSCGQVNISNLKFPSKDCDKIDTHTHRDFTERFVVILTCGTVVLASDVVVADEYGDVNINKNFRFTKLPTDFDISVCIYSMRVANKLHASQKLSKKTGKTLARLNACRTKVSKRPVASPQKKYSPICTTKSQKKHKVLNAVSYIKPSSFTLWGKCEIRSPELSKARQGNSPGIATLKMNNTPLCSSLSGMFSVNIKSEVELYNRMSGFLTIGLDNEHGCTIWNTRWCVLEGYNFRYWNYPSEETTTSPLGSVDLSNCVEQLICPADRSLCARPRTLMLPIRHDQSIKKYLLSTDEFSDMKLWEKELNYVVCVLRIWNCINSTNFKND